MGILHEVLLAIGVALMLAVVCSLTILGREFFETGHVSLAVLDNVHAQLEQSGSGYRPQGQPTPRHF